MYIEGYGGKERIGWGLGAAQGQIVRVLGRGGVGAPGQAWSGAGRGSGGGGSGVEGLELEILRSCGSHAEL